MAANHLSRIQIAAGQFRSRRKYAKVELKSRTSGKDVLSGYCQIPVTSIHNIHSKSRITKAILLNVDKLETNRHRQIGTLSAQTPDPRDSLI
jgi:hypothetical protein